MRHAQYATVVVLIAAIQFTWDFVTRSACACAARTTTLNHEVRNDTVERESVIKPALSKFDEVGYCAGRIVVVKLHGHVAFFGMDDCFFHGAKIVIAIASFAVKYLNRKDAKNAKILGCELQLAHSSLELTSSVFVVFEEVERSTRR